jgi:RNA polymerase sigma-70 factor, ECF subfamily
MNWSSGAILNLRPSPIDVRSWLGLFCSMDAGKVADDNSDVMDDTDRDDIRRTLDGDGEAYRQLIERHEQEIAKRMRRFSRDPRVLEELVHDVFVEAYFSLHSFRGDAPFEHWLHRIAVRVGYKHWSAKGKEGKIASMDDMEVAAPTPVENDSELLAKVLDRLSPRDRLVVTLMYLEEHSVEETAKLTGWSKTMVKVQAFRARGKLKKMMEKEMQPRSHEDAKS